MALADAHKRLEVRANADTPWTPPWPRRLGATGIGLCRTEHMFFQGERIQAVREMILPTTRPAAAAPWPSCCRCSARTSKACSAPWAACR
jgi:hypothetical protein